MDRIRTYARGREVEMGPEHGEITRRRRPGRWLLVLAYVPASCCLVGLTANLLKLQALTAKSHAFKDVFWSYAVPVPGTLSGLHLPALALGFVTLLLLIAMANSKKPVLTLLQVRVILLVLIVLFTIIAKIGSVIAPLSEGFKVSEGFMVPELMLPFLFAGIDLILIYLLTFLPMFRGLKAKPA